MKGKLFKPVIKNYSLIQKRKHMLWEVLRTIKNKEQLKTVHNSVYFFRTKTIFYKDSPIFHYIETGEDGYVRNYLEEDSDIKWILRLEKMKNKIMLLDKEE